MPLAALTPAAPPLRVQARQVRSAGPAVPGAHRPGHRDGCRCSEAQGRAFQARGAPVRTPCAPLSGLIRGLRALPRVRKCGEGKSRAWAGQGAGGAAVGHNGRIRRPFHEVCHVGSTRPPTPPVRGQPATPSLGRGPGTRAPTHPTPRRGPSWPSEQPLARAVISSRGGGGSESRLSTSARLHRQRCAPNRAAGALPATRWALGGGCAVATAARRRWGCLAHPWWWSGANLPQGSRWF